MTASEPERPLLQRQAQAGAAPSSRRRRAVGIVGSAAVIIALFVIGAGIAGQFSPPPRQGDSLSAPPHSAIAAIVAAPIALTVSREDRNRLMAAMPATQQLETEQRLAAGELELVNIGAVDWGDVDGDVVMIGSGGVSYTRLLTHDIGVMTFVVPRGAPMPITIAGIRDGRPPGGISVGIGSGAGWTQHLLQPGQTIQATINR